MMVNSTRFGGTTFVDLRSYYAIRQPFYQGLKEAIASHPEVKKMDRGFQYLAIKTGKGHTKGDDAIHTLFRIFAVPTWFTKETVPIRQSQDVDRFMKQHRSKLQQIC